mgnify:CR=1 FL=1|tara:strand:+ start:608 stop:2074 length:1467 start_codon:yes stop_codon:yes gene_type:complete
MAYLDNTNQAAYYQGNNYGDYQFISLDDIITQFQIMYIGEDKLIPKAKRADIAFHAQRALAELSFDTFKSFKSHQIDVPPSLTMILPHDYVNYTKVSWVDGAGIKRPIYPTRHTSNPFQVKQDSAGDYVFEVSGDQILENGSFEGNSLENWKIAKALDGSTSPPTPLITALNSVLNFKHISQQDFGLNYYGDAWFATQQIDVSNINHLTISADGVAVAASGSQGAGQLRFGLVVSMENLPNSQNYNPLDNEFNTSGPSPYSTADIFDIAYLEWAGVSSTQQELAIDVSQYETVWATVTSYIPLNADGLTATNTIDNIQVLADGVGSGNLQAAEGNEIFSSTWNTFKSATTSEHAVQDYRYEENLLKPNERYGLSPEHAQTNGTFYIDQRLGKIHFGSNISGKTVILDYISDSLGTHGEMQVPKLAEDAMYKHMLYDVVSARSNIGGSRLQFHKREKFAAVRKAKLRLSSIKLEELTQILRGQSKHIKH